MAEIQKDKFPLGFYANRETLALLPTDELKASFLEEFTQMEEEINDMRSAIASTGSGIPLGMALGSGFGSMFAVAIAAAIDSPNTGAWAGAGLSAGSSVGVLAGGAVDYIKGVKNDEIRRFISARQRHFSDRIWNALDNSSKNIVNQWTDRLRKK